MERELVDFKTNVVKFQTSASLRAANKNVAVKTRGNDKKQSYSESICTWSVFQRDSSTKTREYVDF